MCLEGLVLHDGEVGIQVRLSGNDGRCLLYVVIFMRFEKYESIEFRG